MAELSLSLSNLTILVLFDSETNVIYVKFDWINLAFHSRWILWLGGNGSVHLIGIKLCISQKNFEPWCSWNVAQLAVHNIYSKKKFSVESKT
jgi:hypothetical protein